MSIYDRQETLDLTPPSTVAIIGVGGVGSHVALNLAISGVKNLILIDDDVLEEHNLNRTYYEYTQIGLKKVTAMAELIYSRRPNCEVAIYPTKYEDISDDIKNIIERSYIVVDCRDATASIGDFKLNYITGGYDGMEGMIHINPDYSSVFGKDENVRYRVTPSYLVPPAFIGLLITNYLCFEIKRRKWKGNERILKFDCSKMLDMLKRV